MLTLKSNSMIHDFPLPQFLLLCCIQGQISLSTTITLHVNNKEEKIGSEVLLNSDTLLVHFHSEERPFANKKSSLYCFLQSKKRAHEYQKNQQFNGIFSSIYHAVCLIKGGKTNMKKEDQARSLFGISLTDRPTWQQFLICSSGFFFGYLVNGICEEYVYNRLQFSYGWYFTFVQGFVYMVLIYLQGFTTKQMVNPWKTYVKLSAVLMGSHGLTKGSLAYLNYPAQIMFKSTKVLPVMVMSTFIPGLRRKYPVHEYISATLLVVGLILFTLADANTSPNFSVIGVLMITGALVMDAFLGNFQEAIFTMNPETTQMEMLFCSTVVGLPFLLPPMILTGELFRAWNSCYEHPYVYGVLVFESMATFVGQVSVLSLIAIFGAATTAMVTTARKAVTLLLSFVIFTKPLTEQHGSGLLLIAMGIMLKLLPDSKLPSRAAVCDARDVQKPLENKGREEDGEKRPLV